MAESNWTLFASGLSSSLVRRGVTDGQTPPSGGGSFVYGAHWAQPDAGAIGLYCNEVDFAPMAKGGSIRAAMKRVAGVTGTPFLFVGLQGPDVSNEGYLVGLAHDESPAHIVIRKGAPSGGLAQAVSVAQSADAYTVSSWLHLRLDMLQQPAGDVLLKVYENDLALHAVTSPVWTEVDGLGSVNDDALGINLGSIPYLGGYLGFGFYGLSVGHYGLVDQVEVFRQT